MTQPMTSPASVRLWTDMASRRATPLILGCAALLAACLTGAQAEELQPIQGRSITLGPVNGIAYYTNNAAGSRLVATLSSGENTTPLRIITTLASGQSLTLSVPHGVGEPATEMTFTRQGSHVFVGNGHSLVATAR